MINDSLMILVLFINCVYIWMFVMSTELKLTWYQKNCMEVEMGFFDSVEEVSKLSLYGGK